MKLGMNLIFWGTHITEDQFPLFQELKDAGYDGVEIPVFEGDEEHYKKMGQAISAAGLEVTVVTCVGADNNPASSDPEKQKAGLDSIKWAVDMSVALGAKMIVGPFYAAHGFFQIEGSIEEGRQRSAKIIKEAAQYAQKFNIHFSIEFLNRFEIFLLNCTADTAAFVKLVDEPNVGVLYDTHHANIEEKSISEAFKKYGQDINHIHFSESHRGTCGTGQINWEETKEAVKSLDFDGWIVVEAFAHDIAGFSEVAHVWRPMFETRMQLCEDSYSFIKRLMA